jgi:hypothetical protein
MLVVYVIEIALGSLLIPKTNLVQTVIKKSTVMMTLAYNLGSSFNSYTCRDRVPFVSLSTSYNRTTTTRNDCYT